MKHISISHVAGRRLRVSMLALATAAAAVAGCSRADSILEVEDPDVINPQNLNSASAARALAAGVALRLSQATSGDESLFLFGGLLADEWRSGDTFEQRNTTDQRAIVETNSFLAGQLRTLMRIRIEGNLELFVYETRPGDEIRVANRDVEAVREAILAPKFNFGAPRVAAVETKSDGGLVLAHEHASDGRGLDAGRAKKVLEYTRRVWRRPVRLHTVNDRGEPVELTA